MKLITYKAIRPGIQALGSHITRAGTNSPYSHTEIMFEPGDGVDEYMPDLNSFPDDSGAVWCASASASDRIPPWSIRRPNKLGGVRFKRIDFKPDNWFVQDLPPTVFNPVFAAKWFRSNQGAAYDWRHVASFGGPIMCLIFNQGENHFTCTEACAAALGYKEPERFHPGNFPPVIGRINMAF